MSYIPASSRVDLLAVVGAVLAVAVGLAWWVRRGDRLEKSEDADETPDPLAVSQEGHATQGNGASPV